MMHYSVLAGNIIRFYMEFKDEDRVLTDPSTVTCEVQGEAEDDEVETLDVVHTGTGTYTADWDTTDLAAGIYHCKATGTGDLTAVKEIKVRLRIPFIA